VLLLGSLHGVILNININQGYDYATHLLNQVKTLKPLNWGFWVEAINEQAL